MKTQTDVKNIRNRFFLLLFLAIFFFGTTSKIFCLSPMNQYRDLVAGNGESGFKDGPFYSAEFNQPMGIALNADESILYVADQKNNLIRGILLREKNKVITLAGSVKPGREDGPLSLASFNQPKDLVVLPNNRIAVFDQGNQLIRLVDLSKSMVYTVAGGGKTGQVEGDALKVQLGAIWNLVYYDKDQCLYFSLPDAGILQRLDLKSGKIATVLKGNALLPHPKALLCAVDGKFYIADQELPQIYQFLPSVQGTGSSMSANSNSNVNLKQVAQLPVSIFGLAGSGKTLYAFETSLQYPIYRIFPNPGAVAFASGFGYLLTDIKTPPDYHANSPGQLMPIFQSSAGSGQVGFIYDPKSFDRFYITNPSHSFIAAIRDYTTCIEPNDSVTIADHPEIIPFSDPECRYSKPAGTFRILTCARSFMDVHSDNRMFYQPLEAQGDVEDPLKGLPKQMEVELNTRAALEDFPVNFEVLRKPLRGYDLLFSSYWVVPDICAKYDLDLVLFLRDDKSLQLIFEDMLFRNVDADGVPSPQVDLEFGLKTVKERFPSGPYHDFLEYAVSKKLVEQSTDHYWLLDSRNFLNNNEARERAIKILGQPLKMMKKKMDGMRTKEGKIPQLVFCYFPAEPEREGFFTNELEKSFWRDLCREEGVTFIDLCDDFAAIGMSYHPYILAHFTENGMNLFTRILVHELIHNNILPTKEIAH